MSLTENKRNRAIASLELARELGVTKKMIDFGVHLSDNLGSLNGTKLYDKNREAWRAMLDSISVAWDAYKELTGGFTIDDARRVIIYLALEDRNASLPADESSLPADE